MADRKNWAADDRAARRRLVAEAVLRSDRRANIPFRGAYRSAPVVAVPIGALLFRAANGRLMIRQRRYITEHDLASDYFEAGEDSPEVQALLQSFLAKLAREPVAPLYDELRRAGVQIETLLITADGVTTNGNRRLAAMRELLDEDRKRFGAFAQVEAVVLPEDAGAADIEMVEATLQMSPETKLAYGWLDRRLKLRRQRDLLGIPLERICEGYRIRDPAQVETELRQLALAERYLREYCGQPDEYALIEADEALFAALAATLAGLEGTSAELWRLVGFTLIHAVAELGLDAGRYFPFRPAQPAYASRMMLHRFGVDQELWPPRGEEASHAPLSESDQRLVIASLLRRHARHAADAAHIARLYDQILHEHRHAPGPQIAINQIRSLNRTLRRIDAASLSAVQARELAAQLDLLTIYVRQTIGDRRASRRVGRLTAGWRRILGRG
jgi:hypothetical protein